GATAGAARAPGRGHRGACSRAGGRAGRTPGAPCPAGRGMGQGRHLLPAGRRSGSRPRRVPRGSGLLEQALQALEHLPEHSDTKGLAIELRLALAYVLNSLGEYGRHLALLGEAEALARALDDRARLGRVLAQMASVLRITGAPDGAMTASQQALALA